MNGSLESGGTKTGSAKTDGFSERSDSGWEGKGVSLGSAVSRSVLFIRGGSSSSGSSCTGALDFALEREGFRLGKTSPLSSGCSVTSAGLATDFDLDLVIFFVVGGVGTSDSSSPSNVLVGITTSWCFVRKVDRDGGLDFDFEGGFIGCDAARKGGFVV